jgi:hypothetical protein
MSSDEQQRDDEDHAEEFAHEDELRHQSEAEPLAGCDVEHCQRMHE